MGEYCKMKIKQPESIHFEIPYIQGAPQKKQ